MLYCPPMPNHPDTRLARDLKTLVRFIDLYCRCHHATCPRDVVTTKTIGLPALAGRDVRLCPACRKLLMHAVVKRSHCPMDPKPACKHCPNHCYHPTYRQQIRQVMAFAGRRMVLMGRLDYLWHLFF
jgi:hypothetical protein